MTSVLNVDTIADKAGTGPVGLTKQNTIKVFYVSSTTFGTADNSFAISSSSDSGTGQTAINFANAFANSHWAVSGVSYDADGTIYSQVPLETATSGEIRHYGSLLGSGGASDAHIKIMFTGDLA